MDRIFYICAAICFGLKALNVPVSISLVAAGFFFLTLSLIF